MFTHYVLENPWPLGIFLFAAALILAWMSSRSGGSGRLKAAGVCALLAGAVLLAGTLVVTAGEHARQVVLDVVAAAVAGDVPGAGSHFSADATLSFASETNPGLARAEIERRLDTLDDRYRIASNDVTSLRAESAAPDRGIVRLGCRTVLDALPVPVPTQWAIEVTRQPDGTWKISHMTWLSIADRVPTPELGR